MSDLISICKDLKTALGKSKVIIAPIPLSSDRQNILTPFSEEKISITEFLNNIEGKSVIGGNFSEEIRKNFESKNVEYIDLIKSIFYFLYYTILNFIFKF